MILEHRSQSRIRRFRDVEQTPKGKPSGLWFSSPGVWRSWAQDESAAWEMTMEIADDDAFSEYPWIANGTDARQIKILKVDMSSQDQLDRFIDRYKFIGCEYQIDWPKVRLEFGGVYFHNVQSMPSSYYVKFNQDGCWILSIDIDSVCIWNKQALGPASWSISHILY
jgi:hypothetical protein